MHNDTDEKFIKNYRITPKDKVDLSKTPTLEKPDMKRSDGDTFLAEIHDDLKLLQNRLYAEGKKSILVVIQAMDTGGKDGTIRKVFGPLNPQGVRVHSFKQPNPKEISHDFLWRIHTCTPKHGMITIFNRSHYEDVLIQCVHKLAPKEVIERRYTHINNFEYLLHDSNTHVIKLFLHISKDEQKKRIQDRLDKAEKNWKFTSSDIAERKFWDQYMKTYELAINNCSTEHAPWYVIPGDKKWWRNIIIARIIRSHLNKLHCEFPAPEPNLDKVIIPE